MTTASYKMMGNNIPPRGPQTGSGRHRMETPFGRVSVSGAVGDVVVLLTTDIYTSNGSACAFYVQALGGSVSVASTLAPPDLALNPDVATAAIWANATVVAPGTIVELSTPSTALQITFTQEKATVYVIGA